MNNVMLIGNLTKDPETKWTTGSNQRAMCRFTIAVNDRKKNHQTGEWEDNPSFIRIVAFGKTAESCDRYLTKGNKVAVSGKIQTGSYEKDGEKKHTTDIIANHVEFLSPQSDKRMEVSGFYKVEEDTQW